MSEPSDQQDGDRNTTQLLFEPNMSLNGPIDESVLPRFLEQLSSVRSGGKDLILELNTLGGDADVARRIALEIRLFSAHSGRAAVCVGKSYVYSAGVTIFAAFQRSRRYLTEDAVILIHERRLQESIELSGPINACIQIVAEKLSMLKMAQRLELEGFAELVRDSNISLDELFEHAKENCYMTAESALKHGLVEAILR